MVLSSRQVEALNNVGHTFMSVPTAHPREPSRSVSSWSTHILTSKGKASLSILIRNVLNLQTGNLNSRLAYYPSLPDLSV